MPTLHLRSICGALVLLSISCAVPSTDRESRGAPVTVIAHRGLSGLAPEHTWEAYDRAIEIGADYIEQDLHMSADGVLVILHDDTLERTARGFRVVVWRHLPRAIDHYTGRIAIDVRTHDSLLHRDQGPRRDAGYGGEAGR